MSIKSLLQKVHDNITEENSVKEQLAVSKTGQPVRAKSPEACKWCLLGHLSRLENSPLEYREAVCLLDDVIRAETKHWGVTTFFDNEKTSIDDVKRVLEIAILKVKGEEE